MKLDTALNELAKRIEDEILARLRSQIGINPKTGANTLVGSNLEASINVAQTSEDTLVFSIADYWEYVVLGWRKTGRFPNTAHQFIVNITDWVRNKNIHIGDLTQNQIVWMLYKKMIIDGETIAPRPFIEYDADGDPSKILPFLDEMFERWAEDVFEAIINEIKYFK